MIGKRRRNRAQDVRSVPAKKFKNISTPSPINDPAVVTVTLHNGRVRKLNKNERQRYTHIHFNGTTIWFNSEGELHNINGPAVTRANGSKEWWRHGEMYREDGPTQEHADGTKEWRNRKGFRHRENGPAIEWASGTQAWWREGVKHRDGGPAVCYPDGSEEWWVEGKLHREGGPAVSYVGGVKEWWVEGKNHRLDGPAVIGADNNQEWWVDGTVSGFPELCEKAVRRDLTDADFYELCIHHDYVVRSIAVNNPDCADEWRTLVELKNS